MFKAMESEEAVCEARTTNRARGGPVQARSHSAAATRFYPARASSAGSGDRSSHEHVTFGNFAIDWNNLSLKILVMRLKNKRDKKQTAIDWSTTKRVRRVQGQGGDIFRLFSNHNSALNSINIGAPRHSWCINASMWMAEIQQSVWGIHGFRGELRGSTTSILPNQRFLILNNLSYFALNFIFTLNHSWIYEQSKEISRRQMDSIEGTNRISNEKDCIDRIFFDSREDVCREGVCRQW